jgi:methyl-accepting chemotaxis protein
MRPETVRRVGIGLMALGGVGLALCLIGFIGAVVLEQRATAALLRQLDLAANSLTITADGLVVASDSLSQAGITLVSIQRTLAEVEQGLTSASGVVGRVADVVGDDIPTVLGTTKAALTSAETAAGFVDNALEVVNRFIPATRPPTPTPPLAASIREVATSLDGLSAPLAAIETDLTQSAGDLQRIQTQLGLVRRNLTDITTSLDNAKTVIVRYRVMVDDLKREVARLQGALPGWLGLLRWGAWILLLCAAFGQMGLLAQGWFLVQHARSVLASRVATM